ncbi:MAG: metal ABC transporter ATP-binding protein [Calothrix sp. FI2-JRJ7]|jgi:ABC-type Mn2+/Zn2+ transport system ATPase subunit|nr:metal ABC transporter ATP-binding protein [Calothrix sp. FI2-JRJ7]
MRNKYMTVEPISILVEDINVAYHEKVVLHNASFELNPGCIAALVGPNGGGKSTLFKAIMGFLTPHRGKVVIKDLPIRKAQQKQMVAYVPQSEEVDWNFPVSVEDVVMMGRYGHMNWLRIPTAEDHRIVQQTLERVGMYSLRRRQIGELSGGQRKRVFLARALAQQGTVMLLDEPFTGVDANTEKEIIELLITLRAQGHTILISTHDLGSISTFCDQVVFINRTILAYGSVEDVFTDDNLAMTFGGVLHHRSFYNNKESRI